MNLKTHRAPAERSQGRCRKRERARRFNPRKYPADCELMRVLMREAEADKTGNPVYRAIAGYVKMHFPDLLD